MRRIGVFGGTFNPPHVAHYRLALEAVRECALDEVIIMPTFLPPHKQTELLLPGEVRMELCKLTFTDRCFSFSDYELNQGGKSYTVKTLRHLKALYPGDRLFLIIGSDMLLSFDRWFRWQEILSLCTLIVLSRESSVSTNALTAFAKDRLQLSEGGFYILQCPPQELSSTQIRAMLHNGEDVSSFLIDDALQLILEKGYYL